MKALLVVALCSFVSALSARAGDLECTLIFFPSEGKQTESPAKKLVWLENADDPSHTIALLAFVQPLFKARLFGERSGGQEKLILVVTDLKTGKIYNTMSLIEGRHLKTHLGIEVQEGDLTVMNCLDPALKKAQE